MIRNRLAGFSNLGILPKLLGSFLILSVIPLVILGYFAHKNLMDTGFQAVREAEAMGRMNLAAAQEIGMTSLEDSVRALDRKSTEAIELRTVELAQRIADFLYERDQDIRILSACAPDPATYLNIYTTSRRDVIATGPGRQDRTGPDSLAPGNPENKAEWRHRPPDNFPRVSRPLYREITFIDTGGKERIKVADGKISRALLDITEKKNTFCRAEDYFARLKGLKAGDIYVSEVVGAYVPGWIEITDRGVKVKPGSAYAGKENPRGKKFEGIIRWAAAVYDEKGEKRGYVTMALDHTHIMEFTDHVMPTEEGFTRLSDGGSGNYAFIWDYRDRCISHARDFFIFGYNPATGREVPGWMSEERYKEYRKSGLSQLDFAAAIPPFSDFSKRKAGSPEQIAAGTIPLDCKILDTAPQCQGWHEGTEDGGSGSFLILWSGVWKLTTYAAIPYYTGMYSRSKRGFGYVTIGANVEDFHKDANVARAKIGESILREGREIMTTNTRTWDLIGKRVAHNRNMITAVTVLGGAGIIAGSVILSLQITMPLRRLTEGAMELSKGNYNQHISVKSNDEIGKLALSFNDMAEAITKVDKMKSDFVTIASHELRTPIQAMLLGVSGILEGYSGPIDDEVREDLELARDGIERLMRLVADLLDLSRIEAHRIELHRAETSVPRIIDRAVEEVSELAHAHRHIIAKRPYGGPLPPLMADEDRMVQVVINLLSNSIKYSPDGGKIEIGAAMENGEVLISIADNGYGVPAWAREEIFKKFFQADSIMSQRVGGTGLGLTISRGIVEHHGGTITCESPLAKERHPDLPLDSERKGSVFVIRIPLSSPFKG